MLQGGRLKAYEEPIISTTFGNIVGGSDLNHAAQADQAAKQAVDDDELLPLATKALAKLFVNNMNWAKVFMRGILSIVLKYFNTRIDKSDKMDSVVNALEQAHKQAPANTRGHFDEAYNAAKP